MYLIMNLRILELQVVCGGCWWNGGGGFEGGGVLKSLLKVRNKVFRLWNGQAGVHMRSKLEVW